MTRILPGPGGLMPVDAYTLRRRDSRARVKLSRAGWNRLPAYDSTIPTGVIIGKRWRRSDRDGNWVGSYFWNHVGGIDVVFRRVVLLRLPRGARS